jgi:hypothetical protein
MTDIRIDSIGTSESLASEAIWQERRVRLRPVSSHGGGKGLKDFFIVQAPL